VSTRNGATVWVVTGRVKDRMCLLCSSHWNLGHVPIRLAQPADSVPASPAPAGATRSLRRFFFSRSHARQHRPPVLGCTYVFLGLYAWLRISVMLNTQIA